MGSTGRQVIRARTLLCLLIALASLWSAPALAWGEYGHRTTAEIAMANVRPETAARIRALLAVQRQLGTPACPVRSLADAAAWPDCIRKDSWRFAYTFPWHYQTEPVCMAYDPKGNCANGNCVTAQIERNRRILADRKQPAAQRLEALAFLVHFIGDIHMPLHSGDDNDAGGNAIKADYGIAPGWKLHSIWDTPLAERAITSAQPPLVRRYSAAERAAMDGGTPADWGRESWEIARTVIYPLALGHDPCAGDKSKPEHIVWTNAEIDKVLPIVRQRIEQAGLRMARVLDEALGPQGVRKAG